MFRRFLQGDLGVALFALLAAGSKPAAALQAALYELNDAQIEAAMIALGGHLGLILANGSDKAGDGNAAARAHLNAAGIPTIDRQHQLEHHRPEHPGEQRIADRRCAARRALPGAVGAPA